MIDLRLGDSLEMLRTIPDKSVDLILTDPPYELTNSHSGSEFYGAREHTVWADIEFMTAGFDYEGYFREFYRICKVPNCVIFCSNNQVAGIYDWWTKNTKKVERVHPVILCWEKSNAAPLGSRNYNSMEYIVWVRGGGAHFNDSEGSAKLSRVYRGPALDHTQKTHPTEKPQWLLQKLLFRHSFEGDLVVDAFMGTGSCALACKDMGRNFIGMEIRREFFDIAKKRVFDAQRNIFVENA